MYTCKLIDLGEGPSSQRQSLHESNVTNWKLCVICQRDTTEKLVDPDNARYRGLKECGYKLFADNILEFNKINCLSEEISIRRLDNGEGIEATLQSNKAVWHKSCRNRYDNQKLQRAQKRKAKEQTEFEPSPIKTRHSGPGSMTRTNNCFFCDEDDTREQLHNAQTDKLDRRIREYAHILQDRKLLGKLSEGDMHALDARYHLSCMTSLSNCVRKHNAEPKKDGLKNKADSLVLAELVSYIEECRSDETLPVFKLSNLRKLYESRLKEKDPSFSGKVNTTRLKERLMSLVPDLKAQTQGREVMMMFNSDIGEAIKIACANNNDDDAIHLARAAQILRKDIFAKEYTFDGSFKPESERDAVPESVLALVSMILRGPSIQHQKQAPDPSTKIALSLSQLVVFNAKKTSKESKESSGSHTRHIKARETPLVIYTGLMIHAKTRQRGLLDKLSSRGLSISYERTKEISTNLGNAVCAQFDRDGCVCPTTLKSDVFTVGAVDNIDHNPSARNAMDSFHGTAISMLQFPTPDKPGTDRDSIHIKPDMTNNRTKSVLPAEYTEIAPAALPGNQLLAPVSTGPVKAESTAMTASRDTEDGWLRAMSEIVQKKEELDPKDFVSWAAYHANRQSAEIRPLSRTALLPLFTEQAHNPATIVHAMKLVAKAIDHLHPGQKPVITMDQPLFCIAKQIQWTWPDAFGEDRFVVVMGGLHIEMNVLKLIGDFLSGSGWTTILVQSEVTTAGRADAILKGSHVTRSRYVHQVAAATLYLLQVSAYEMYQESLSPDDENMDFTSWCNARTKQSPQFQYWTTVLELELLVMQFVRSLREADTRLILHALHCAQCGHKRVMIRSVDTDVVVLAIANFHALGLDELWVAFGVKKHYRVIPVHDIATNLGEEMARALPFFHAVSGCDTTSSFSGIGKKTAWDTWAAFPAITGTFVSLSEMPAGITDENLRHLERFVILLFDRTSDCVHVDTARKHLFAKGRQFDRIPPTKAALIEHVKRAAYQAGHVWGQSCVAQQNLPNPSDWGWTKEASDRWVPFWSALPEAAKSCKELIKCGCKKACRLPCKCLSASLTCTELCHCAGTCFTFTSDIDDPNSNDDDILD